MTFNTNDKHENHYNNIIETGKNIFDLFDEASTVVVTNTKEIIAVYESKEMKLGVKPGTVTYEAINSRKRIFKSISKESSPLGGGYVGISIPLIKDGNIRNYQLTQLKLKVSLKI
ncbi:hypothetical protein JK636_16500 [Clostridium sp. YIM B02515]|uniref:Uncharacterized protein n=1 Tax=Clostridium rhizosphaerae TaxID=2803861 RepID=A0ABS1TDF0_9CLOT|nr:hypothetical protein [Clostridium rhizosphaerae]MBL4937330.1 hypothetical protein [Clostridium rhizosphaerae]